VLDESSPSEDDGDSDMAGAETGPEPFSRWMIEEQGLSLLLSLVKVK